MVQGTSSVVPGAIGGGNFLWQQTHQAPMLDHEQTLAANGPGSLVQQRGKHDVSSCFSPSLLFLHHCYAHIGMRQEVSLVRSGCVCACSILDSFVRVLGLRACIVSR